MSKLKKNNSPTPDENNNDLGFGTKILSRQRFINKDGSLNVVRKGGRIWTPYQTLVEASWSKFIAIVFSFYVVVNIIFALILDFIGVDSISGIEDHSFWLDFKNAFFFSIQTFTTVGYGGLRPSSIGTDLLASLIAFVGLLSFALATGMLYARFSQPKARILFSHHGVICTYQDTSAFMLRMVNMRNHKIIDVEAKVSATWLEQDNNGISKRQFRALSLERKYIFLFPMNWTIVHPIKEGSPLYGKSAFDLKKVNMEIMVQVKGFDESYQQVIHANSSYIGDEIIWGQKFVPMFTSGEVEGTVVHLDKIDDLVVDKEWNTDLTV